MKPIIKFDTQEELEVCLRWWQEKLHLNHWVIRANLVDSADHRLAIENSDDSFNAGVCISQEVNHCALILIFKHNQLPKDCIMHVCDEKTLVHELLHVKYLCVEGPNNVIENVYYNTKTHSELDSMAQTLIEVKYNLDFDFWYLPNE